MESLCRSVCGGTLPKRIWVRRTLIVLGVLSALAGVLAPEVLAQETPCRVIAIDKSVGVVTAKVEASAEGDERNLLHCAKTVPRRTEFQLCVRYAFSAC